MSVATEQTPEIVQHAAPMTTPAPTAAAAYTNASLYVGDLRQDVTERDIYEAFKECGSIVSIRVCRDVKDQHSLGYAYVNYQTAESAEKALTTLNGQRLKKKPCRVMWSRRDPSQRRNPEANLFVKFLEPNVDSMKLQDVFSTFGTIASCKVVTDDEGVSRGFGFVQFENVDSAQKALAASKDENESKVLKVLGEKLFVAKFIPASQRPTTANERYTNLYVKNFGKKMSTDDLKKLFEKYGEITSAIVMESDEHASRGFGFVNFKDHGAAVKAQEEMDRKVYKWKNGELVGEVAADDKSEETEEGVEKKSLYVARAQKKEERLRVLRSEHLLKDHSEGKTNVFVRNIADVVTKEQLEKFFAPYGTIKSCVVMRDDSGNSRGFGFVDYTTPEEAQTAIEKTMNQLFCGKPLYVALAQPKAVRRQILDNQFRMFSNFGTYPNMYPNVYPMNAMRSQFMGMNFGMPGMNAFGGMSMVRGQMAPRTSYNNRQQQRNRPNQSGRRMPNKQQQFMQQQAQAQAQAQAVPVVAAAAPAVVPEAVAPQQAPMDKQAIGEIIYPRLQKMFPNDEQRWGKLTGMIIESIALPELQQLVASEADLDAKIREADVFYTSHIQKQAEAAEQIQKQAEAAEQH